MASRDASTAGAPPPSYASSLTLLILAGTLVRLIFAATTDLGIDEAYTVATARQLALSTYDHPPLTWWIIAAMRSLTGSENALVLRLPFIGLAAVSTLLVFQLTRRLFHAYAAWFAALLFSAAPVLSVTTGTWILPDGPLIASMLACALALTGALFDEQRQPLNWLLAGVAGGVALLSKYHAVFLFAGTFGFLLVSPSHRKWLRSPWPYLAAAIAFILFTPVIIWNAEHHWASLAFQGSRAGLVHLRIWMPLVALAGQAVFMFPLVWWTCVHAAAVLLREHTRDPRLWFLLLLASGPIVIVTIAAAWSPNTFFHWAAPGYLFLIPLAGWRLSETLPESHPRSTPWVSASLAVAAALPLLVSTGFAIDLPWQAWGTEDPLRDMRTWRGLETTLREKGWLDENSFVASTRWHVTGRLDYALAGKVPVTCLCGDARGYGVLAPAASFKGKSALVLIIGNKADIEANTIAGSFQSFVPAGEVEVRSSRNSTAMFHVYEGKGFDGHSFPNGIGGN